MIGEARIKALQALNSLQNRRITLDRMLAGIDLPKRDRDLMYALVYGVLRWQARLDWILAHFSRTPISRIEPRILNILRLGLFQILYLDRVPVSASVHSAVELAKSQAPARVAGFVNAVLRNAARNHQKTPFPHPENDPVSWLAAFHSFPKPLIRRWLKRFGFEKTAQICAAINEIAPTTLRTCTLNISRRQLAEDLKTQCDRVELTDFSPDGIRLYGLNTAVFDLAGFAGGGFQVQDEAAQLVGQMLAPRPDQKVLDACAGLGGKTGHLAQMMKNRGSIVALDNSAEKLQRLSDEMRRLDVSIVSTQVHDLHQPVGLETGQEFDAVLIDAPCSGLGVLRRNPDAKWSADLSNLNRFAQRQSRFLDNLAPLVRVGGVMVYAVCSMEPEENESVVKSFLNNHSEFAIDRAVDGLGQKAGTLLSPEGCLRTCPCINDMDGFFAARLRRAF